MHEALSEEELAVEFLKIKMIEFGSFRMAIHEENPNAPESPFYINMRIIRSYPNLLDAIASCLLKKIGDSRFRFDLLADVPTSATPIVTLLSHTSRIPMITPRLAAKKHGSGKDIDGVFAPGQRVLLIEDVVTSSGNTLEAIRVLKRNGLIIEGIVVLIDREQGGIKRLEKAGYPACPVFKFSSLLQKYFETGNIDLATFQKTKQYLAANQYA